MYKVSLLSTVNQCQINLLLIAEVRDQRQTDQIQSKIHSLFRLLSEKRESDTQGLLRLASGFASTV